MRPSGKRFLLLALKLFKVPVRDSSVLRQPSALSAQSRLDLLRPFNSWDTIVRAMVDVFESVIVRERIIKAAALLLLLGFICGASYLEYAGVVTNGRPIKAQIVRFGMHPVARVAGGDLPILTVRLPDGSIRDVRATWADVNDCLPGRWISLLQQGTALQVGRPGCDTAHSASVALRPTGVMTLTLLVGGALTLGLAVWAMMHSSRRERPSPDNNWENEDYLSRGADGTWAEGSTYSKSPPGDSTGLGL